MRNALVRWLRPRPGDRRAQVEPFPALVAVAMLGLALSAYAGVLGDVPLAPVTDATAGPTLLRVLTVLRDGSVVDPGRVHAAVVGLPGGHWTTVTIEAGRHVWTAGPAPPGDAATATRRVPVRIRPGLIRPGTVTVWVWP